MYPRTIEIKDEKLKGLLTKKGELIEVGRAKSIAIEALENEMEEVNKKLLEEEAKIDIQDLNLKQKVLIDKVNEAIIEMEAIKAEIYERMMKLVPKDLHDKYDELKKKKEELETERNKMAMKAQKYNDKIIPIARELMKPHLTDQYEDYDTLYLENGEIFATVFSHLTDFKNNFKKKQR